MNLPHRFPCRLVDRTVAGRALLRVSANAFWQRGAAAPAAFLVEAIAQAAAVLLAPEAGGTEPRLALAAVESAAFARLPAAGETLEIAVALEARLGALVRVRGEVTSAGEPLGAAVVVLAGS